MLKPLAVLLILIPPAARSAPPEVVADIAPVQSLVAQVMRGLGTPALLMQPGASPHDYAMRPSEARALSAADAVFWIGPALTPQLGDKIATLAPGAVSVPLLDLPETGRLAVRDAPGFAPEDHDDHEDHDEEGHDENGHDGHDAAREDDHDHGGIDPHAWLDPDNATLWLDAIAATLSRLDPGNAVSYRANAEAGAVSIAGVEAEIAPRIAAARDGAHIVFHDAFQYFETHFDLPASGAIALSDASDPGPARIAALRDRIAAEGVGCVLSEPQFNAGLVATVFEGSAARTAVIDPLGSALAPGPDLYPDLLRSIAAIMADCR